MQGGRPPQPSGTNSPSSHPSLDTAGAQRSKRRCRRSRLVSVSSARCAALRARGGPRPQAGGAAHRSAARAGGARPVPFRTRKLSPRAPRVLRRKSVGGQGAADRWTAPSADPREEAPGETRGPFAIPGRPRPGPFCALCGRGARALTSRYNMMRQSMYCACACLGGGVWQKPALAWTSLKFRAWKRSLGAHLRLQLACLPLKSVHSGMLRRALQPITLVDLRPARQFSRRLGRALVRVLVERMFRFLVTNKAVLRLCLLVVPVK